eukprot:scaffold1878_cov169-Ochromonas_danica.AAC.5
MSVAIIGRRNIAKCSSNGAATWRVTSHDNDEQQCVEEDDREGDQKGARHSLLRLIEHIHKGEVKQRDSDEE